MTYRFVLFTCRINLELFSASDVMTTRPVTLTTIESVAKVAGMLLDVNHGGFPVVAASTRGDGSTIFHGFIHR